MAGRTRDARISDAVLDATVELLDETGYPELSIGAVARRAGVHRPAVYRRWPSKRHLVVDALGDRLGLAPTPDTGDLRADLVTGMLTLVDGLAGTPLGRVLPPLVADLAAEPELAERFMGRIFHPRRATTAATLRSAIRRGVIRPDFDMDFVLDALAAPLFYRVLFGHLPLTRSLAEQTVDGVLTGLRTDPRM